MMISEKVIGTRLGIDAVEKLEQLATYEDKTVSQLMREAVLRFLEAKERTLHPLSLEAAVTLAAALKRETKDIFENTSNLISTFSFGDAGGVYLLVHQETRELYVGSSTELTARLTHHKFSIKTCTHKNQGLNSWSIEDVVVVILEKSESKKDAATKKALLAREQHYIDVLKTSKDWTLLNLATATLTPAKETPTVIAGVPSEREPQTAARSSHSQTSSSGRGSSQGIASPQTPTAFEQFYTAVIEQALIPILDEKKNSRDVVKLFESCKDEQEKRWFLEFLGSYNSSWLVSLASSGKFPWISKLMEQVRAVENTNL